MLAIQFGSADSKAVPGDYSGDGKADIAFFSSSGQWYILRSEDLSYYSFPFGLGSDLPVPGDYDGDGLMDAAVFRDSSATWYIQGSNICERRFWGCGYLGLELGRRVVLRVSELVQELSTL